MKPPAFQFYADDFICGTFHFSDEEAGQYIRCLCHQWSLGGLTEDELSARTKSGAISPRVLEKFVKGTDGLMRNKRLEAERKKQKAFRDNKKQAGKAGANKRWQTHASAISRPLTDTASLPMANDSSPSPSPSPSPMVQAERESMYRPSLEQVKTRCQFSGYPEPEGEAFWNHFEASGWIDKNGHQIKSWEPKLATWVSNARAKPAEAKHHGAGRERPLSPLDMRTIIGAKENKAETIKRKHCSLTANGDSWQNKKAFEEWRVLRREIRELNDRLSKLA